MQPERPSNSWVVGVGSSAGGLEALMTFVSHLPANSPASYIFAQHLPPHLSSMMVELLSRDSKLPIVAATDNNILIPGEILMIPPNYDGEIVRGRLVLTIADDLRGSLVYFASQEFRIACCGHYFFWHRH
jgi:two-component system CheB/CheR fusion protein